MVRITRVYTRTGDKGDTALVGGKRVPKDSPRIDAYGTIDELNSVIGLARAFNAEKLEEGETHLYLDGVLAKMQDKLVDLGSELATPEEAGYEGRYRVGAGEKKRHEGNIDPFQKDPDSRKSFILPAARQM